MKNNQPAGVDGLINLGYEAPDYSAEPGGKSKQKTHTVYPTFRVCQDPAAELHQALTGARLLDGEFAAIVVLKNSMVRVADDDEDEEPGKDVELEFVVKALLPHVEAGAGETEESIMADFEKLPAAKQDQGAEPEGEEE